MGASNRVLNWSFEDFTGSQPVPLQVARYWTPFVLSGSPAFYNARSLYTSPERIDGSTSQLIRSTEPYDAGVYQVITGLRAGNYYSVLVYVLSIFRTSAVSDPRIYDGLILKQIGVDPEGGINPLAPSVIWNPAVGKNMDRATWGERMVFEATGSNATLFIRVQCLQPSGNAGWFNEAFIDGAQLRASPLSQVTVPDQVQSGAFTVSWKALVPGASGSDVTMAAYDVQYRDGIGPWQDWLVQTTAATQSFNLAQPGHTYTLRARAWGKYYYPYAEIFGPWAESAPVLIGKAVELTVTEGGGVSVYGVSAQLTQSGSVAASGRTDFSGRVYLSPPSPGQYDLSISSPGYLAPPPMYNVAVGEGVQPVAMSLRPLDDVVNDGSFEETAPDNLPAGWQIVSSTPPSTEKNYHVGIYMAHCGHKSLELDSGSSGSDTVLLRTTYSISNSYRPALSLWYRIVPSSTTYMAMVLNVRAYDGSQVLLNSASLQSQQDTGWKQLVLPLHDSDEPYSGAVTLEIGLEYPPGTQPPSPVHIYIDDISLGRSSGGPYRLRLPLQLLTAP